MTDTAADPTTTTPDYELNIAITQKPDALRFRELLGWTAEETARWEEWLRAQDPAVLAVSLGDAKWPTVGDLIFHVFMVERRYTDRLYGDEATPYESVPHATLDEIFAVHHYNRPRLERWVDTASAEAWEEVLTFETISAGTLQASKRKIIAHALMHGVRHWAQIAMAVRQAGYPTTWMHDILMSEALS